MQQLRIDYASIEDIPAIEALRSKLWYCVGFCPIQRFRAEIDGRGGTLLTLKDGHDLLGYIHATHGMPCSTVLQVAVWEELWRQDYGSMLVKAVESIARRKGRFGIKCRVAYDLEANVFWDSLGYPAIGYSKGRFLWKDSGPKSRIVIVRSKIWQPLLVPLIDNAAA